MTLTGMRICHVHKTAWGHRWKHEPLRELRNRYGHHVTAVIGQPSGALIDQLRSDGIPCLYIDHTVPSLALFSKIPLQLVRIANIPVQIARLAVSFRRERFDVVQWSLFESLVSCRIAAWLADVPVRITMPASPAHLEAPASRWIDQTTLWMDTALVGSCELTCQIYRTMGVKEERLALIYYGPDASRFDPEQVAPVDLRHEYGWGPETRLIGNVAFFNPRGRKSRWLPPMFYGRGRKGQEDIIRAAPNVLAEFPEARFLLIGSGTSRLGEQYQTEMQELVKDLGLEDKVVFPGYRPDSPGILRTLDVSIQAAVVENLGGTVESLLLERPMVATRVGGLVDSVRDGETGVLVEPANPASLAEGILRLLRDPQQAEQYGKAGRQLMLERFTLSHTVTDLHNLYTRLLYARGTQKRGYRPLISLGRCLLVIPIALYIIIRLIVDQFLLPMLVDRADRAKGRMPKTWTDLPGDQANV
jgi:glycosyltransferase involved in cell wall biosynthesis